MWPPQLIAIIVSLQKAMRNNFKVFFSLDKLHRNGQIDWDEYYGYYMKARLGMEAADLRRMEADPASVGREVREAVAEVRAAWSEAARSNPEAVNIDAKCNLLVHLTQNYTLWASNCPAHISQGNMNQLFSETRQN